MSKYYYYPTVGSGRSKIVDRDRAYERNHDYMHRPHSPDLDTPELSRSSTPLSSSSPPTPTMTPLLPVDSKMAKRHVEFASPVTHAFRRAEWDELSVMRAFASHASHCDTCHHPLTDRRGGRLCERGTGLAKDLGTYFYCYEGKPHSNVDKLHGREKVQVEVPMEYGVVKNLFSALDSGLDLRRSRQPKPEIRQAYSPQSRPSPTRRYTMDSIPSSSRRHYLDHADYDTRPSRTGDWRAREREHDREREPVYRTAGGRFVEDRTPYYEQYADRRRPKTPPMTPMAPITPVTPRAKYPSRSPEREYWSHDDAPRRRRPVKIVDDRVRDHREERYWSPPRRRDSLLDRYGRRRDEDRSHREPRRHYASDDEEYRRPKRYSGFWSPFLRF